MLSGIHRCPICNNPLFVDAYYEEDPDFGSQLTLELRCLRCRDTRVQDIDGINELLPNLIKKIGI